MPEIKLKPCPFCGCEDAPEILTLAEINCRDLDEPEYEREDAVYAVACNVTNGGCGCSTGQMPDTPEEAAALWNRRDGNG